MKKLILTDCDGVLVNWNSGFHEFMKKKNIVKVPDTDGEYSLSIRYGLSTKQKREFVKEFNESSHIEHLEPFADSVNYVKLLSKLDFRFIVISSLSDDPTARKYRVKNLTKIFGNVFDDIICIEMGSNKFNTLINWADTGYFWIEDHMAQAEAGYEVGLRPILIEHSYNKHYQTDLFPKVSHQHPWQDIFKIITEKYDL